MGGICVTGGLHLDLVSFVEVAAVVVHPVFVHHGAVQHDGVLGMYGTIRYSCNATLSA